MYFSLITPHEGYLRQAAHDMATGVADPYKLHQWLWRFFPDQDGKPRDFLFRRQEAEGAPRFYVVSRDRPVPLSAAWDVQSKPYQPLLREGQRLAFELRANPVVSKKTPDGRTLRHDVVMAAKQQLLKEHGASDWASLPEGVKPPLYELVQNTCSEWLSKRAEGCGFVVARAQADAYEQHRAGKRDMGIRFSTVDFSGELTVVDPTIFEQTLLKGIGHAKAFGCGLLLVKRC